MSVLDLMAQEIVAVRQKVARLETLETSGAAVVPRAATFFVAASNATAAEKAGADYVCDGTSDEVEINAAITAVATAGGGTVVLSRGYFTVSGSIVPKSDVSIIGSGHGGNGTRIHATWNSASIILSDSGSVLYNVTIREIFIDANGTGGTAIHPYNCRQCFIENCTFFSCKDNGIILRGSSQFSTIANCYAEGCGTAYNICETAHYNTVSNCKAWTCTGYGVYLQSGADENQVIGCHVVSTSIHNYMIESSNNLVSGCFSYYSGLYGFRVIGNNNLVTGCYARNAATWGFTSESGSYNQFVDCRAEYCNWGFYLSGYMCVCQSCKAQYTSGDGFQMNTAQYCSFIACEASGSSQGANNTYDNFRVFGGDVNAVIACRSTSGIATNKPRYSVRIETGVTNTRITACVCPWGHVSGGLSNAGTGTSETANFW